VIALGTPPQTAIARKDRHILQIEHGTWVVVADGATFLLARNIGDEAFLHLEMVDHMRTKTPSAHALGSDRPGRRHDASRATPGGVEAWGNSAMEQTDLHRVAEERFAVDLAEKLGKAAAAERFTRLIIVADARTLGVLRASLDDSVRPLILTEIDKDWTNLPLDRIEAALTAHSP
jgi:protein required for attachment to host cells